MTGGHNGDRPVGALRAAFDATDGRRPLSPHHVGYLLLSLAMVMVPHALHQPWWISAVVATLVAWRAYLAFGEAPSPGRWLMLLVAAAATLGVFISFRTIFGREAGVALLVIMVALKCLETRTRRDAVLLIYLAYFIVITNFLRDQSILVGLYMLACTVVITGTMIRLNCTGAEPPFREQLRAASLMLAQSVPLMVLLFLLFPRVPGPLWGLPQDTRTGVSGLSDTMTPGSLSRLTLSDDVAFRVQFDSAIPGPRHLYWRGPVMWDFDGRTWTSPRFFYNAPRDKIEGKPVTYQVTLEPHNRRWLFALDIPGRIPPNALITGDFLLLANQPVKDRMRYDMESLIEPRFGETEHRYALRRALTLPPGSNPRTIAYARELRAKVADEQAYIDAVLLMFRRNFVYTLEPPTLGEHPVDEFLFSTRTGFCEHFASAFAVLMRAAGIPARIVTGYQGGQVNVFGNYLIVRQADAHAWTEVWLDGRGWVRIDPTFAAAPQRVDTGLYAAVPAADSLPMMVRGGADWLRRVRLGMDFLANSWNQWVLGYTPDRQRWLLSRVGIDNATWEKLTAALLVLGGAIVALLAVLILRQLRSTMRDPVKIAYARFCEKLRRRGLPRAPSEGPLDYARRVAESRPELAAAATAITRLYVALRYGGRNGPDELDELRQLVSRFQA